MQPDPSLTVKELSPEPKISFRKGEEEEEEEVPREDKDKGKEEGEKEGETATATEAPSKGEEEGKECDSAKVQCCNDGALTNETSP